MTLRASSTTEATEVATKATHSVFASLTLALFLLGTTHACVLDLPPLITEELSTTTDGGTIQPPNDTTTDDAPTGDPTGNGCPKGTEPCGDECVPEGTCPCPCSDVGESVECVAMGCDIGGCAEGFADCNSNLSDGCELDLRPTANTASPLPVRFIQATGDLATNPTLWESLPLYALQQPACSGCSRADDVPDLEASGAAVRPNKNDLRGGFKVAHNDGNLLLRVLMFDDSLVNASGLTGTGPEENAEARDARSYDNAELLFDASPEGDVKSEDNQLLFVGIDAANYDSRLGDVGPERVRASATPIGTQCTVLTIELSQLYLSGKGAVDPNFEFGAGSQFGLNVGLNDFDPGEPSSEIQRQSHLFYEDPGNNYWIFNRREKALPRIELQAQAASTL